MSSLLSLGFEYKGCHHSFIARVKQEGNRTEYHITLMSAELEKSISVDHIVTAIDGQVIPHASDEPAVQKALKEEIVMALRKYLHQKSLTSY